MKKLLKSRFIKNSLTFSGVGLISQFIVFSRDFAVRRILPPEIMGFWSFCAVVRGFLATFDLGCNAGALRELPITIATGEQNREEQERIRSTTLLFAFGQYVVVGIIAACYIYLNSEGYVFWQIVAGYLGVMLFVVSSIQAVYTTFLSADQEFVILSKLLFLGIVFEGIAFPVGAYLWGLAGIMVMSILGALFKIFLFFISHSRRSHFKLRLRIYKDTLKRLLSFGFFLKVIDYPNALFNIASIVWVTKFMSIEALALFSLARSIFLQVTQTSVQIRSVYAMRVLDQFGRGTPRAIISVEMKRFLLFQLLVVVPLIVWGAAVILPFVVNNFIPKYSGANGAVLILLICVYFVVINSGLTVQWIAEKRLVARGISNLAGLMFMVSSLGIMWFVLEKRSISAVACSTLIGYFLYFIYMVIAVGRDWWNCSEIVEIIIAVTVAAVWTYVVIDAGYNSVVEHYAFLENLRDTFFMGAWTLLALLPIPLYGLKRSRILKG